ncbi:sigma-70 family RNA polymerase sigma factor [Microbacterium sp.]|uniref:RNA polymerase sigma factor n=1 Tax=Microbacterium sp. TaxID=51671 RepID=UPI0033426046
MSDDAWRQRKKDAFSSLYDTYWGELTAHVDAMLDDPDEVADLVSDVFVLAYQKFDPDRPLSRRWLLRAAANKVKDRQKREKRRERAIGRLHAEVTASERGSVQSNEMLHIGMTIARVLSEREYRVFTMWYWEELPGATIASRLGISEQNVRIIKHRALKKVEKATSDSRGGEHDGGREHDRTDRTGSQPRTV